MRSESINRSSGSSNGLCSTRTLYILLAPRISGASVEGEHDELFTGIGHVVLRFFA